jgi:ferritin
MKTPIKPKTLNPEVVKIINTSIGFEYTSHMFWNAASNWCANKGYNKAAAYYTKESMHELDHVKELQNFLLGWNIVPTVPQVETSYEFDSLVDTVNQSYSLMVEVFDNYVNASHDIFAIDLSTFDFLQQFRIGQIGALANYSNLLSGLELIDTNNKLDILFFEDEYFTEN